MKRLGWLLLSVILLAGLFPCAVHAANLEVEAKSALLLDVATGTILFEQNAHEALAPASVTKVMTMLLIMEAIDSGKIGWSDTVTVSEAAAAKGGSQVYLKVGEAMTVEDMVKSIAVSSANDCGAVQPWSEEAKGPGSRGEARRATSPEGRATFRPFVKSQLGSIPPSGEAHSNTLSSLGQPFCLLPEK